MRKKRLQSIVHTATGGLGLFAGIRRYLVPLNSHLFVCIYSVLGFIPRKGHMELHMVFEHYSSEQTMKGLCLANAITDAGTCGYGKNRPMISGLSK